MLSNVTLVEYRQELRDQIKEWKYCLRTSLKDEQSGIDQCNGTPSETGKYQMKVEMEHAIGLVEMILKRLNKITRIR